MATITSALLTIAAGRASGSVVVGVHGPLDVAAAATLEEVLDLLFEDSDVLAICVDLRDASGRDTTIVSRLADAAVRAVEEGAELTLSNPPETLRAQLASQGLSHLVRVGQRDLRPPWRAIGIDRGAARRQHPAGRREGLEPGAGCGG